MSFTDHAACCTTSSICTLHVIENAGYVICDFNFCRGIMPYGQRKKIIEKVRLRGKKSKGGDTKGVSEIQTGQMVCLRSSPIYHVGAIGFTTVDGIPKVGQLMQASWSLNDVKRFKIKPSMR